MTIWLMRIACWIPKATNTHTQNMYYLLNFHCNNGCTMAPQRYVLRTLTVLLLNMKYMLLECLQKCAIMTRKRHLIMHVQRRAADDTANTCNGMEVFTDLNITQPCNLNVVNFLKCNTTRLKL